MVRFGSGTPEVVPLGPGTRDGFAAGPESDGGVAEPLQVAVDVSDVQVFPWGSFVFFKDPDGNGWALQAMTHRE